MHGERASTVRLREPTEPERKYLHFVLHDACGCTATAAERWASWLDGGEPSRVSRVGVSWWRARYGAVRGGWIWWWYLGNFLIL